MTVAPVRRALFAGGALAMAPAVVLSAALLVAGAAAPPPSGDCGAAGTGGTVSGTALDAHIHRMSEIWAAGARMGYRQSPKRCIVRA